MKKISSEEQMMKNGGKKVKTLTITCNGTNKSQCGYKTAASGVTQLAEIAMGIHLKNNGHYLCTYKWTTK